MKTKKEIWDLLSDYVKTDKRPIDLANEAYDLGRVENIDKFIAKVKNLTDKHRGHSHPDCAIALGKWIEVYLLEEKKR